MSEPRAGDVSTGIEEAAPPVVAVVVTHNPGPFLEETLAALAGQDYPTLSVLVVDAGSEHDPTARVGATMPGAFVRRLGGNPGFGGAANEALAAVTGATFFLVCHDDVALDPPALRVMIEEAFRSNAGIVAPKLVSADDPDVLLDVGRAIDRLGGSHTGIEPGEIDQEQHDAVRDVFYVSSAAMLVRADLFHELGGFDPDTFPGSEDLDLCWRARLAGARVMVAPDARGRHREAATDRVVSDRPSARDIARRRARVILTSYSLATLLWVVPFAIALSFVELLAFAPTRRRRDASAGFAAWWWNLLHLRRLRAARRRTQALRRIHDRELRELQVGAGARFGAFLSAHRADERVQTLGERGRDALDAFLASLRHPASALFAGFLVLVALGSRDLLSHGVPAVGTLARWPGVHALTAELSSAWRHTGLGSTDAAPPVLAIMVGLGTVLLGGIGLAQTLVVVGAFVIGTVGTFRLVRGLDGSHGAAGVAALAYGVSAVVRNSVANGRLGPLVLFGLAPFVTLLLVRAGRFPGTAGASRRPLLGLVIVTAVATAWYPPAALVGLLVGIVLLVSATLVGDTVAALRAVGAALVAGVGAAVLLLPWTATLVDARHDRAALGLAFRPRIGLTDVLRFQSGPNGAGIASWGLVAAAVAGLVITTGPRFAWVVRAWMVALAGYATVYLPIRLEPDSATAAPEAGLVLAALGLAVAAGLSVGGLGELLARAKVGWRQVVGGLGIAGVVLGTLGFAADAVDGRWRAPDSWSTLLSFTSDKVGEGEFRILWLGDPAVLPLDPVPVDATLSYSLTRDGPGDARDLLRAPVTTADRAVAGALRDARRGRTSRLGRILAPMGIRYVALARRNGPSGAAGRTPPDLHRALAQQLDLARLGGDPGLELYENQSWAPLRAEITGRRADTVVVGHLDPLRAAASVDLTGARSLPVRRAPRGVALLAEAYDSGWSATAAGRTLRHGQAFGLTNAWTLPSPGTVSIAHDGQGSVYLFLAGQIALWLIALVWWSRGRRREPRPRTRRAREERPRPPADFPLADDDDSFWVRQ